MNTIPMKDRLAIYGWKGETEEFYYIMAKLWVKKYSLTFKNVEQLLFHPTIALEYVENIRELTKINVPEEDILQTLSNLRKNNYISAVKAKCE